MSGTASNTAPFSVTDIKQPLAGKPTKQEVLARTMQHTARDLQWHRMHEEGLILTVGKSSPLAKRFLAFASPLLKQADAVMERLDIDLRLTPRETGWAMTARRANALTKQFLAASTPLKAEAVQAILKAETGNAVPVEKIVPVSRIVAFVLNA